MRSTHLEREARHYWEHAKRVRMKSGLAGDMADSRDELSLVMLHSEHPVIKRDVAKLLDQQAEARARC